MCLKSWGTIIEEIDAKEDTKEEGNKDIIVEEARFIYN
jgi:hypothetical protein